MHQGVDFYSPKGKRRLERRSDGVYQLALGSFGKTAVDKVYVAQRTGVAQQEVLQVVQRDHPAAKYGSLQRSKLDLTQYVAKDSFGLCDQVKEVSVKA
jgi:hypothetical protein